MTTTTTTTTRTDDWQRKVAAITIPAPFTVAKAICRNRIVRIFIEGSLVNAIWAVADWNTPVLSLWNVIAK